LLREKRTRIKLTASSITTNRNEVGDAAEVVAEDAVEAVDATEDAGENESAIAVGRKTI